MKLSNKELRRRITQNAVGRGSRYVLLDDVLKLIDAQDDELRSMIQEVAKDGSGFYVPRQKGWKQALRQVIG